MSWHLHRISYPLYLSFVIICWLLVTCSSIRLLDFVFSFFSTLIAHISAVALVPDSTQLSCWPNSLGPFYSCLSSCICQPPTSHMLSMDSNTTCLLSCASTPNATIWTIFASTTPSILRCHAWWFGDCKFDSCLFSYLIWPWNSIPWTNPPMTPLSISAPSPHSYPPMESPSFDPQAPTYGLTWQAPFWCHALWICGSCLPLTIPYTTTTIPCSHYYSPLLCHRLGSIHTWLMWRFEQEQQWFQPGVQTCQGPWESHTKVEVVAKFSIVGVA